MLLAGNDPESITGKAVSLHFKPRGMVLDQTRRHQDTSTEAAKLELIVLRVSLPLSSNLESPAIVSFARDTERLTADQAAAVLSGLSKPVVCTASKSGDGTLLVDCKPMSTVDEENAYLSAMGAMSQHFGAESERDKERHVQVLGIGEARPFSLATIRQWSREYVIPPAIAFGHRPPPTDMDNGEVVEEVLELLHVDDVDPNNVAPDGDILNRM